MLAEPPHWSTLTWCCWLLALVPAAWAPHSVRAQAVKGGSGGFNSNLFNQQQQVFGALQPGANGNQFSSSFIEMFNQLTPVQQQQFIRQMSSSNRRIFQQAFQPQQTNFAFSEEVNSNSGGLPAINSFGSSTSGGALGATKSAAFRQSSSSVLSPVQQAALFRSQQSKSFSSSAPTLAPSSQFSFSRQISQQQQQQPILLQPQTNEANFQSSKTIVNSLQPAQQSFFNRVQSVQQVAQPVVLPSTEQSFRRVQKFSSQPLALPVDSSSSSFSQQQFVQQQQQQQPVQLSSSFNRFQQQSQQLQPGTFNQFSGSSSSNLAGNGAIGSFLSGDALEGTSGGGAGFANAANLQQEKVELDGTTSQLGGATGNSLFQQSSNLVLPGQSGSSSFEQSSSSSGSGFDSADAQQKNLQVPDDFYGLTAASINNKWYIMKPVENLQQMPLGRALINNQLRLANVNGLGSRAGQQVGSSSDAAVQSGGAQSTPTPKKRSAGEGGGSSAAATPSSNKKKKASSGSSSAESSSSSSSEKPPVSTSSSLMEPEESSSEEEERKR